MNAFDLHPRIFFIGIVAGVFLWLLMFGILFALYEAKIKVMKDNCGDVLLIFGFIISIGGLLITGSSIQQYRRQITTFSAFAKRLKHMIDETSGDSDGDYVRIMAYTPIPGSLALKDESYKKLKARMIKEDARLEIMCLNEDELSKWFNTFEKKRYQNGEITKEKIDSAQKDINELIENLDNPHPEDKKQFALKHQSKRLKANQLPGYYLFFSDNRAIVTTPLFLPENPDNVARNSDINIKFENKSVEMIGFETTDSNIIEQIKSFYIVLRNSASGETR